MSLLRQLFIFTFILLLSACGGGSDDTSATTSGSSQTPPPATEPAAPASDPAPPPPRIDFLIVQMQPGEQQVLDFSGQITTESEWQITRIDSVKGPVSVLLDGTTQVAVTADSVGLGEIAYEIESEGETYKGQFAVIVSTWQNNPPQASTVTLSSDGSDSLEVDLTEFISDPDQDELSVSSLLQSGDRLAISDLVLSYDPQGDDAPYTGVYIVSDENGGWAAGLVLVNNESSASQGEGIQADLLLRDINVGQTLVLDLNDAVSADILWELVQAVASNNLIQLEVLENNQLRITALEEGVTQVDYLIRTSDDTEDTSALVVLAISDVENQLPYANTVTTETDSDTSIVISLAGQYGDMDGDAVSVTSLLQTDNRFSLNGEVVTYIPNGFIGVDSATYLVMDEWGAMAAGLIVVEVSDANPEPENQAPVATDYSTSTASDTPVTLDLAALGLVSDPDGDSLTLSIFGGDGRVTVDGLQLTFQPAGFVGTDEFVYEVNDGRGGSALGHIDVTISDATPVNQAPVASSTSRSFTLQQIVASPNQLIDLSSLVTDPDGDGLAITQVYGALANVSISGALALTYAASSTIPEDSFSYVVSDGKGGFAQGTVNVSIDNQAPIAQPITLAIDPYAGSSLSIDLSLYSSDADGDSLTLSELGSATAPATISSTGLLLEYTPNGFTGTDSISYSVSDGLATASSVIQITSSSQAVLTANDVSLGSFPLTLGLLVIDMTPFVSNSSGRSISFSNVYGASLGTTSFNNSDLLLRYTPDNISYGTDTIFYEVTDGEGNTATATVTLTLSAPAAPVITSLTLDYQGDVTASLTCSGCDHPARTEFQFEVAGVPVTGSGAVYSPTGDDKEKAISVRARVKNQYCNADDSGVNGSNACLITEGQVVIKPKYVADVISGQFSHAALMTDGTVVTWGDAAKGADSSAVQAQLTDVVSIANTEWAYAAIKSDDTVVAWGNALFGGNASAVQADLTNVTKVFANAVAFAALKSDGSVVTWGEAGRGGNSSSVQAQLTNVVEIFSSEYAFAALKADGSVVTWGETGYGADSTAVSGDLVNVETISSTRFAFAALKEDGTVVAWGNAVQGGDASAVQVDLINVAQVFGNWRAFAAVKDDGSVVTWGNTSFGGDSSAVQADLTGVDTISNTTHTFAALKSDNTVVTWGSASIGGDSSSVQAQLVNVDSLSASLFAYAALIGDDTVVTWGQSTSGGDSTSVQPQLTGVEQIISTEEAFLALKSDDTVVAWGNASFGGDNSAEAANINIVSKIWSNNSSFVVQNADGSIVTWGDAVEGGDSSTVQPDFTGLSQVFLDLDL